MISRKGIIVYRSTILGVLLSFIFTVGVRSSTITSTAFRTTVPENVNPVKQVSAQFTDASDAIVIDHNAEDVSSIPIGRLDQARQLRTFFTHKSIGNNIMEGIAALQRQNPGRYSIYVDYGRGNSAGINHYQVGQNGQPLSKIAGFEDLIRNGPVRDIAFMKLCTGDFPPWTRVVPETVWEGYRDMFTRLQSGYPGTVFVWWTLPLASQSTDRGNAEKAVYNALVRQYVRENGGILFDLADIESHDPEGNAVISKAGNEAMHDGYTDDGAHLNEAGRQRVAHAFWWLLARVAGWQSVDHWIAITPETNVIRIYSGESATYDLSITASADFTGPISLSLLGGPQETTISFEPNTVIPSSEGKLHLTTAPSLDPGTYVMTIKGTAEELTTTSDLTLIVKSPPNLTLGISPSIQIPQINDIISYTIVADIVNEINQPVTRSVAGFPQGVDAVWSENPVTVLDSSVLNPSISNEPKFDKYLLQVVGISEPNVTVDKNELVIVNRSGLYLPVIVKSAMQN